MSQNENNVFNKAVWPISLNLKRKLLNCDELIKNDTYEIRLRANRPVILFGAKGSLFFSSDSTVSNTLRNNTYICSGEELTETFNRMCGYSIHAHQTSINNGFVTMRGGHRAGIAGTAVLDSKGEIINIRDISSLNIRIARESDGCSSQLVKTFFKDKARSLIIAGPPSSGKTTMLKDLAKKLSSADGCKCFKLAIIDEREELAAVEGAIPNNNVGLNCDILNSYPKEKAVLTAVRTLSPEIIVCDEIGSDSEVNAIKHAVNTGVRFVVSIHASDFDELVSRPQVESLLRTYSFDNVVMLAGDGQPCKIKEIYEVGDLLDEINRRRSGIYGNDLVGSDGIVSS